MHVLCVGEGGGAGTAIALPSTSTTEYVGKPFAYGELRLRIAAVLRRSRARVHRGLLRVGALEIDPVARLATIRGRPVVLAAKEFALLVSVD